MPRPDSDKSLGSLVGLAVCEALAKSNPSSVSENTPLIPGLWGDGTSMALSLAESLIEIGGIDQRDQMVRYTSWFRYGYLSSTETCDFIDDTVKQAILRFERTWNPLDESLTQGDVCLARVAPVVMYFTDSRDAMLDACAKSTATTHASPQSVDACRLLAAMIYAALHATEKSRILRPGLPEDIIPEIAQLCSAAPRRAESKVAAALQSAMEAFSDSDSLCRRQHQMPPSWPTRSGRIRPNCRRMVRPGSHPPSLAAKLGTQQYAETNGKSADPFLKFFITCQN